MTIPAVPWKSILFSSQAAGTLRVYGLFDNMRYAPPDTSP
jgi:hypothetical protein